MATYGGRRARRGREATPRSLPGKFINFSGRLSSLVNSDHAPDQDVRSSGAGIHGAICLPKER
jgi:hypothetical protein